MRPLIALLFLTVAGSLHAQTASPASLAGLVLSETPALGAAPDLASWRKLHPGERLKQAAYDNEYESQGLWCAASVADLIFPGGLKVTRQAFFYAPPAAPGAPLPDHQDPGLRQQCRLLALWYEVDAPANSSELLQTTSSALSESMGSPDEPSRSKRPDGDWGSGYWNPYKIWQSTNSHVVLAVDPGGPLPDDPRAHKRLLVIARSSLAPHGLSFAWMGDPPKDQPTLRNAPEAEAVARLEKACSFDDGHNNWQGGLIQFGEKLLRDFPSSRWQPYIHLTLARAYAARLILTYPGVELDGAAKPANPDDLRRGAIAHFRAYLDETPDSPEAAAVWREAWRLLAGLPPSPIHFACTD